jgi:hypothetical protein
MSGLIADRDRRIPRIGRVVLRRHTMLRCHVARAGKASGLMAKGTHARPAAGQGACYVAGAGPGAGNPRQWPPLPRRAARAHIARWQFAAYMLGILPKEWRSINDVANPSARNRKGFS